MKKKQSILRRSSFSRWFLVNKRLRNKNTDKSYSGGKFINKRHLSAEGCSLLPSALRPRLLVAILSLAISFITLAANSPSTFADSITLTIPKTISVDVVPKNGGSFSKSDEGIISVKTDSKLGYTLSVKTKDDNLSNGDNQLGSIPDSTSEENFQNNAAFNNAWGFLPSKLNSAENKSFLPGTSGKEITLDATSSANTTDNKYSITLGAKVDDTLASGDYTGTIVVSSIGNSSDYMQDWHGCAGLAAGTTISLMDRRDGNIYTVAKLDDGKCWMVDNLNIGEYWDMELTPDDTDITENYTLPTKPPYGQCSYVTSNNDNYQYCNDSTYGGYYTWTVATAGTAPTTSYDTKEIQALSSICPKGWHLPTGRDNGDFKTLLTYYSDFNSLTSSPVPGFKAGGYVRSNGGTYEQNTNGYYFSSNASSQYGMGEFLPYVLALKNNNVEVTASNYEATYGAFNVRCVADNDQDPVAIQDVAEWGSSVQEGEVKEVIDKRDGNYYNVTKLKDGKLWMLDNLRLGSVKLPGNLTPEDSDVKQEYDFNKEVAPYCSSLRYASISSSSNRDNSSVCVDSTYGGYYTYRVATVETGIISNSYDMTSWQAPSSICPKGWHLPTARDDGDFKTLLKYYTDFNALTSSPTPSLLLGGYIDSYYGREQEKGKTGYYFSSNSYAEEYGMYGLIPAVLKFNSSNTEVTSSDYNTYEDAYNIRCVTKP